MASSSRGSERVIPAIFLLLTVGVCYFSFFPSRALVDKRHDATFLQFTEQVDSVITRVSNSAVGSILILHDVISAGIRDNHHSHNPDEHLSHISQGVFSAIATNLIAQNPGAVRRISFVPHIATEPNRIRWEAYMGSLIGDPNATLTQFPSRTIPVPANTPPYFASTLSVPLSGDSTLLELSIWHEDALTQAATTGGLGLTALRAAVQDPTQFVSVACKAIYNDTSAPLPNSFRDENVIGFVSFVYRLRSTFEEALLPITALQPQIYIRLHMEGEMVFAAQNGVVMSEKTPSSTHTITSQRHKDWTMPFLDSTLHVEVIEVSPLEHSTELAQPFLSATAVLLIMGLLWVMYLSSRRRARVQARLLEGNLHNLRDFVAMATHDLRTPLHCFQLASEMLTETDLTEEQQSLLDEQDIARVVMKSIIDNVLTHEKVAAGQLDKLKPNSDSFDLQTLVTRVVKVCSAYHTGKLDVKIFNHIRTVHTARVAWTPNANAPVASQLQGIPNKTLPDTMPMLLTDMKWIQQIVMNFLTNAIKFTSVGQIDIDCTLVVWEIEPQKRGGLTPNPLSNSHRSAPSAILRIEVHDTGNGVLPRLRSSLFQRFSQLQTDHGGLGLGLYSIKAFCTVLGGSCGVTERTDGRQGSVFWTEFPVELQQKSSVVLLLPNPFLNNPTQNKDIHTSIELVSTPNSQKSSRKKCLVVDDVALNLRLMCGMLKKLDVDTVTATDGVELLHLLLAPDADQTIDMVLTDVNMPRLQGTETVHYLRLIEAHSTGSRTDEHMAAVQSMLDTLQTVCPELIHEVREVLERNSASPRRRILVCGCTATQTVAMETACREAGMDQVLFKPVAKADLAALVQDM